MSSDSFVAYAAGDHRIAFPATVAMKSLEEHNPEKFHKIICFDGSELTADHQRLFRDFGIEFLDARSVPEFNRIKAMPLMQEGRWPAEVFLNWALPEHLLTLGHQHSLKLDYDVVCVGPVTAVDDARQRGHHVAFRRLKPLYSAPTPAVGEEFAQRTGLAFPSTRRINVGVGYFDGAALAQDSYFEKFLQAYQVLMEIAPQLNAVEQVALAAVSEQYGKKYAGLPANMNRFARPFKTPFEPEQDMRIVHFNGDLKPWKVLDSRHENMARRRGQITPLLMRELWLSQAQTIEGFEDYIDARPVSAQQLLVWSRRLEKDLEAARAEAQG